MVDLQQKQQQVGNKESSPKVTDFKKTSAESHTNTTTTAGLQQKQQHDVKKEAGAAPVQKRKKYRG